MTLNTAGMPEAGKKAPAFTLPNEAGEKVALTKLKGQPVVLYFYPKDNTPGCTVEAKEFRDAQEEFEELGAVVLGVSPDDEVSHTKFIEKFALNFCLLADPKHLAIEKYGVWVEKTNYGRNYMGVQRATFLIDAKGKIAHVWPKVRAKGHAEQVLTALRALQAV